MTDSQWQKLVQRSTRSSGQPVPRRMQESSPAGSYARLTFLNPELVCQGQHGLNNETFYAALQLV